MIIKSNINNQTDNSIIQNDNKINIIEFDESYYNLNIVMPLIMGLFVAMILGWMLIRYKMSANEQRNYTGSIYCCPDGCYDCCAKIFLCHFGGFRLFLKKSKSKTPKITIQSADEIPNSGLIKQFPASPNLYMSKTNSIPSVRISQSDLDESLVLMPQSSNITTITDLPNENSHLKPIDSINSNSLNNSSSLFSSFWKRDSLSSRRDSILPGLMRTNAMVNSSSFFLSFQTKDLTSFT